MGKLASILLLLCTQPFLSAQDFSDASDAELRRSFNQAANLLKNGKFRETETLLESVVAAQREKWQPPALYNLGHARFAEGLEELQKTEQAGPLAARGSATAMKGEEAASDAADALQGNNLRRLVNSYTQGRGALRDLRSSIKAVTQALKFHAAALNRWERASSDWKGAFEMDAANRDAKHNAEVADRHIARLIDSIRQLQQALQAMQGSRENLKQMMGKLKGRIPEENMPPGAAGDDDEDEEGGDMPPSGQQEAPNLEGEERPISPEEAGWILEGFKTGEDRRLPMGQDQQQPRPQNRARSW